MNKLEHLLKIKILPLKKISESFHNKVGKKAYYTIFRKEYHIFSKEIIESTNIKNYMIVFSIIDKEGILYHYPRFDDIHKSLVQDKTITADLLADLVQSLYIDLDLNLTGQTKGFSFSTSERAKIIIKE